MGWRRKVMVNGFFVTFSVAAEGHFMTINDKEKVQCIDEGAFTNIVGADQLK
ncbi:MAG: hypothetical protein WDO16_10940 [Bacteroidota bacterium]